MTRLAVLFILTLSVELSAQPSLRESDQYDIVNVIVNKRDISNLFADVSNEEMFSCTDTLKNFLSPSADSLIPIDKVQQYDFKDQISESKFAQWDARRVKAHVEQNYKHAYLLEVIYAAMGNEYLLPKKYKQFFGKEVRIFRISLPIFTIDRNTAYVAVSSNWVQFKGNHLEMAEAEGGIYIFKKRSGRWIFENHIPCYSS